MTMHDRVVSELTQLDERKSRTDKHWNRHFLGIALGAVEDMDEMIAGGSTVEAAFSDCFTPSREMHSVARKLGLALNVDRGRWV